ncbi:MAG TPA: DoxX family protein [Thermoanaerobaculia bacterium]
MASTRTAYSVAIVRIVTGVIFFAEGFSKITGDFVQGGFVQSAREMAAGKAWPFWSGFLKSVVIPNATGFGWFFALAELALGVALILGFLARAAAVGGILLMVILLLGQTDVRKGGWTEWVTAGLPTKFALLLLWLLFLADAGRVWGIDARVGRRPRAR